VYSILRAPKADGTESIVLNTHFDKPENYNTKYDQVSGVGLLLSLTSHLKTCRWLAKDIILIVSDGQYADDGIRFLLRQFYSSPREFDVNRVFPRAGSIQAALNIDLPVSSLFGGLVIKVEGSNGQLPNLDLLNTIVRVSKVEGAVNTNISLSDHKYPNLFSPSYFPNNQHPIRTLFTFMLNQAIGVPTGDHGVFNSYHIDSVTISVSKGDSHGPILLGRVLVSTLRSLNNLLERLHQSFYYYLLLSPSHYLSIGEYMISFGLIVSPLTIHLLMLVNLVHNPTPKDIAFSILNKDASSSTTSNSRAITHAFCTFLGIQISGLIIFATPLLVHKHEFLTPFYDYFSSLEKIPSIAILVFAYFFLSAVVLKGVSYAINTLYGSTNRPETDFIAFKTFSMITVTAFISCMSLLNFSFCIFVSILVVPVYTFLGVPFSSPSSSLSSTQQATTPKKNTQFSKFSIFVQMFVLIVVSPVFLIILLTETPNLLLTPQTPFVILSTIFKQFQLYKNLSYPFLTLIYFPLHLSHLELLFLNMQ